MPIGSSALQQKKDNLPRPAPKLLRLRHLLNADAGDIAIFGFDFKFRFMLRLDVPHHLPPQSFGQGFQPLPTIFTVMWLKFMVSSFPPPRTSTRLI